MKRFVGVAISLSLSLVGTQGGALAQEAGAPGITTTTSGDCVTSGTVGDWTIVCGDLGPGSGLMVVSPPVVEDTVPASIDPLPAPAPAPEPVPVAEPASDTSEAALSTETAVATETDRDADNYADALEAEAGLDPTTADTDADHVADGDEFNLYKTDPTIADTDGDGALDGEELFGRHTDPLLWEDVSAATTDEPAATSEPVAAAAPESASMAETTTPAETSEPVAAAPTSGDKEAAYAEGDTAPPPEVTTKDLDATYGDAAALGPGAASAAPGTMTGGSGASLLGPDGTYRVTESSPPIVNVSGETSGVSVVTAPDLETTPAALEPTGSTETVAPVASGEPLAADTAVATEADQDADNFDDASELAVGLDSNNPDTDADGVADGDEGPLYGTDPYAGDTDGDGLTDGDELFVAATDPLTGDTNGDGVGDGEAALA